MKFEKCHNMSQLLTDCDYCNSKDTLKRIPSIFGITTKKDNKAEKNIERYIKDAKEDVREMKKEIEENRNIK